MPVPREAPTFFFGRMPSKKPPRWPRWKISDEQLSVLMRWRTDVGDFPNREHRIHIALEIGKREKDVRIWFQNQRQRQTERQTKTQTERQTKRQTERQIERQTQHHSGLEQIDFDVLSRLMAVALKYTLPAHPRSRFHRRDFLRLANSLTRSRDHDATQLAMLSIQNVMCKWMEESKAYRLPAHTIEQCSHAAFLCEYMHFKDL